MSSHASAYTFFTVRAIHVAIYYAPHGHDSRATHRLLSCCTGSVVVVPHVLLAAACIAACEPIANIAANADGASTVDRLGTFSLADVRTRWVGLCSVRVDGSPSARNSSA